jgi:hypothetical protein
MSYLIAQFLLVLYVSAPTSPDWALNLAGHNICHLTLYVYARKAGSVRFANNNN